MNANRQQRELTTFQIRNIKILTTLLANDAVCDEIIDMLRDSELEFFNLIDKIKLLEQKINIDEKTSLLKFKSDYLTNIVKTASRVYDGSVKKDFAVSFVRFDIDDFSRFNNTYGHELGDIVLKKIAMLIKESSRPTDYVIRFGGEEFDVILPATRLDGAELYLSKLFEKIPRLEIRHNNKTLKVTVSAGVSFNEFNIDKTKISSTDIEKQYENMQCAADNALYEAKYLGKNQYCIYDSKKSEEYSKIRKLYVK
ncbi:MAG: hypothetical protein A2096_14990 [Spirochaetes bacterium GWF1_41_5]|nr:MAG: hypothetical protein A2096_14990 [Spirochaetes bacterium GWF1_41_5]